MDTRELRQQRGALLKQARAILDGAKKQNRGLSATEQTQYDTLLARANALREEIRNFEYGAVAGTLGGGFIESDADPDPREFRNLPQRQEQRRETRKEKEHREAFMSYLRFGAARMPEEQRNLLQREYRDMGSGGQGAFPGSTAGFFVPVGFVHDIITALKFFAPLLNDDVVDLVTTATGQQLPFPTENDVLISGERVGEGQQVTAQDVSLGQVMLGAWKYSTKMVKVSIELLQDSAFNLEAWLTRTLAIRLGRALVADFTNGTGSAFSMPLGIVTATLQNGNLIAAQGSSLNDGTAAGANTIGSNDLINLEHSIDVLYRPGASYMAHDSTWKAIKKILDKYGRPLWQRSLIEGMPDTLNGYPLLTNNYMGTLQTQASSPTVTVNSVLFGDFKRLIVRRVRDMSLLVLTERFADFGQTAFLGFARYDSSPAFAGSGSVFPFGLLQNTF
jgi:HK97 family phage major capsid protein